MKPENILKQFSHGKFIIFSFNAYIGSGSKYQPECFATIPGTSLNVLEPHTSWC